MNGWFSTNERGSTLGPKPRAEHRPMTGEFLLHGDYWTVLFGGRELRIRDAKGMRYLAELLIRPGTELAALELQAAGSHGHPRSASVSADAQLAVQADLGPVLDSRAKTQYRRRLAELEAEREQAEAFHDPERAARARAEYEQLAAELAAAVGRGRRDRRVGSPEERARVNVTRAIKTAIGRLTKHDRALGEHLAAAVMTGRVCVYRPERSRPMHWRVLARDSPTHSARAFTPPETQYAQANGASVAYQVLGEGETDIVFVPGVISHLDLLWEDDVTASFFCRLATLGRLIMFDKRDTGLSDSAHGDGTLEERMDDMLAVMGACSCRNAVLFGFSEGGPMSIMFTASYPERVRALILGAAAARWTSAPDYRCGRQSDETIDELERIAKHHWGMGDTVDVYLPGLADSIHVRRLLARYERMSASPSAFLRMLRLIRQIDVRSVLPSVRAPTLVIQRLDDRVTPRYHGRYLARHIPNCRYFEQPGDHSIRFAGSGDTDALFAEIEDFLGTVGLPADPDRVLTTILVALIAPQTTQQLDSDGQPHAAIRRIIHAHRGRLIESTSELSLATFAGPGRALHCAAALGESACDLGLQLRVGIHAGEVDATADRVAGPAVDIAHKAAEFAEPGEIVTTQVVQDLVAGSGMAHDRRNAFAIVPAVEL
jgi:pimeloyl-ACP methyl ester carboxylesterase